MGKPSKVRSRCGVESRGHYYQASAAEAQGLPVHLHLHHYRFLLPHNMYPMDYFQMYKNLTLPCLLQQCLRRHDPLTRH
jgi:hypothetical protein